MKNRVVGLVLTALVLLSAAAPLSAQKTAGALERPQHKILRAAPPQARAEYATNRSQAASHQLQTASVLLVDDDWDYQFTHPGSLGGRPYYTSALEALGLGYEVWDVQTQGQPTDAALLDRGVVIWFTGYAYSDFENDPGVFTPQNETRVATYLDAGGRFMLSSQEYYFEADAITPFMDEYLGIQDVSDVWVYTTTVGMAGSPIGDGIGPLTLVRPDDYGEYWPTSYFEGPYDDEVYARPDAETPFRYDTAPFPPNSTNLEGQVFRTVYLGWPFEWLDTVDQRAQVLDAILSWMSVEVRDRVFLPLILYDH